MIINFIISVIVNILASIFQWLPIVTTLPTINGFDLDTAVSTGIGSFNTFITTFWIFSTIFQGFLVLLGYYSLKVLVKVFLGARTPASQ